MGLREKLMEVLKEYDRLKFTIRTNGDYEDIRSHAITEIINAVDNSFPDVGAGDGVLNAVYMEGRGIVKVHPEYIICLKEIKCILGVR